VVSLESEVFKTSYNFVNIIRETDNAESLTVLYPEPPIGYEELQLLNIIKPDFTFITPTMLPILRYAEKAESAETPLNIFNNMCIGISISNSPDLMKNGFSSTHLNDAIVEFARYFLVHGVKLAYGGDLREGGFTEVFL
jgi:hypothetical protein